MLDGGLHDILNDQSQAIYRRSITGKCPFGSTEDSISKAKQGAAEVKGLQGSDGLRHEGDERGRKDRKEVQQQTSRGQE